MSGTGISTRQATRRVARDMVRAQRERKLPATWLGTGGHADPADDGWRDEMFWHPTFAAGGTLLTGTLIEHALTNGVIDPLRLPEIGNLALAIPPGGVVGTAAAGLGLLAGAAGLMATAGEKFSDWARAYFTAGPIVAGTYLAGVAGTSPYNVPMLALAAAGFAGALLGYRRVRFEQDQHELDWAAAFAPPPVDKTGAPQPRPPMPVEVLDPEARDWNRAFRSVGLDGCRFGKKVNTPAGYAILVLFPAHGKTGMKAVDIKLEALERNLGMLKDCLEVDVAIHPEHGRELADRCWIHVDVADILSQTLHMPEDHEPTTITEAFRIGTFMDGKPMVLKFREISALVIGVRGRGKTNLFHVIIHALSRCVDVCLWGIDLKGGRAVKPWMAAWLDGKVKRPIFDWVATTRAEASLMLHAAKALIDWRGNASQGGSKLEPSETNPAVLVLCDEIAALVGKQSGPTKSTDWRNPTSTQMARILTLCIQLGRSECVDFVLFSQRATVTMVGGGDLKSQCEMRIGLGVTNAGDANSVFQSDNINARKLRKLKHKRTRGACLIENGDDPNHLAGKTYYYGDGADMVARIERAAIAHAMYPADLPLIQQKAIDDALLYLTAPRDKHGNITGPGECGYGVGPDGAAAERWSLARAAHLFTDGLADDWTDEDPSDGEHLGGIPASPATTPWAGGVATATRPAAPATAPAPTQRGHLHAVPDPVDPPAAGDQPTGNRYYTRRRDRGDAGEQAHRSGTVDPTLAAAAADDSVPLADLDAGFARYLESLGDAPEPAQLADDSVEELSRYDLMIQIIERAGATGTKPSLIIEEMGDRAWAARNDIYGPLRKAMDERLIVQPAGKYGRYYHRDHAPTRPAQ
ncbi:hypothetical protein AB0A95_33795 [Micromonospora sp. NPDC049230]|uniref:hypothetical protein n=1 Tax=Micromonospora sp. NPDC049230 TaxID=3155502 RepID=UPI0033CCFAF7